MLNEVLTGGLGLVGTVVGEGEERQQEYGYVGQETGEEGGWLGLLILR